MRIKPSKRPKKRYIVFEVLSEMDDTAIFKSIKKSALNVLGARYYDAGIRVLKSKYNVKTHKGILRVNNKYAPLLRTALNKSKILKTLGMSGILKKAEKKFAS